MCSCRSRRTPIIVEPSMRERMKWPILYHRRIRLFCWLRITIPRERTRCNGDDRVGRMGGSMGARLVRRRWHERIVYDAERRRGQGRTSARGQGSKDLPDVARQLAHVESSALRCRRRAGREHHDQLVPLSAEETSSSTAATELRDSLRREALRHRGIEFVDVGTSGGNLGPDGRYCS